MHRRVEIPIIGQKPPAGEAIGRGVLDFRPSIVESIRGSGKPFTCFCRRGAMADEHLRVFVALEGGGAKGLVHIGALKALEEGDVTFCGLAGTSAGAIVSALKAAGYLADEMVNPAKRTPLLPEVDPKFRNATDFLELQACVRAQTRSDSARRRSHSVIGLPSAAAERTTASRIRILASSSSGEKR
jgi:predicted acylesterase/phospholipase RssA